MSRIKLALLVSSFLVKTIFIVKAHAAIAYPATQPGEMAAELRITSLNQCYDTLFDDAVSGGLSLQPTFTHGGRIEHVLRFAPDKVLANRFNDPMLVNALRTHGVQVELLPEPDSLAEVSDFFQQLAEVTHVDFDFDPAGLPLIFADQRVLMLQANHYSFGADTLWDELVNAMGGDNVAPGSGLVTVLPEQVLRLNPDVIVVPGNHDFALASRNVLHGALAPMLTQRAIEVDAGLIGCMAQRIDWVVKALADELAVKGLK